MIQTSVIAKSITERDGGALDIYLRELSTKSKVITPDKEVELVVRIKKGDPEAREMLINANLRFVVSIAKTYRGRGLDLPDLINAGNFGMIKSIDKFDEKRGFRFISHSVHWIRAQMLLSLAEDTKTIRMPLNKNDRFNRIKKYSEKFLSLNERYPVKEEIVGNLKWVTSIDVDDFYLYYKKHKSLDEPLSGGIEKKITFLDIVSSEEFFSPDRDIYSRTLLEEIDLCFSSLFSERDCMILKKFYGIGLLENTSIQIADEFGISDQTVRNIAKRAIEKIRVSKYSEILMSFL